MIHDVCLGDFHTFKIKTKATHFVTINNLPELLNLQSEEQEMKRIILGEGSNVLFTQPQENVIVVKNRLKGIKFEFHNDFTEVTACSGENFDDVIVSCLERKLFGLENLSGIPGTIGAAPIQNIGAYGVELKDVFHKLSALNLETNKIETFYQKDCQFSYRNSVFKNQLMDKYYILDITLRLSNTPNMKLDYPDLQLYKNLISDPFDLRKLILSIRNEKLPNYLEIGNAGSFFKNPVIPPSQFIDLKLQFPKIPGNIVQDEVKIPAAWLIEMCGWKGKDFKSHGVYSKHSLILVNLNNAKGSDILNLANKIQEDVKQKFNIHLEPEVRIY